jgi:hypothetical protein
MQESYVTTTKKKFLIEFSLISHVVLREEYSSKAINHFDIGQKKISSNMQSSKNKSFHELYLSSKNEEK